MIDFGIGKLVPFDSLLEELLQLVMPHADILKCSDEVGSIQNIMSSGTSAERQLTVYHDAMGEGGRRA